jgi:hypothetical protein
MSALGLETSSPSFGGQRCPVTSAVGIQATWRQILRRCTISRPERHVTPSRCGLILRGLLRRIRFSKNTSFLNPEEPSCAARRINNLQPGLAEGFSEPCPIVPGLTGRGHGRSWSANPLLAAFMHVSSEVVFILNLARVVPPSSLAKAFSVAPSASEPSTGS